MTDEIHVSTKDRPGDYDALETAKPDEPIFVVQGGDPHGPATVQHWAELVRETARLLVHGPKDSVEPYEPTEDQRARAAKLLRKATQAEEVSWAMMAYQKGEQPVVEARAHYNEVVELSADEEQRTAQRKMLISSVGHLHNAQAQANDVAEKLDRIGSHPLAVDQIRKAVGLIYEASELIEPRRGSERS